MHIRETLSAKYTVALNYANLQSYTRFVMISFPDFSFSLLLKTQFTENSNKEIICFLFQKTFCSRKIRLDENKFCLNKMGNSSV